MALPLICYHYDPETFVYLNASSAADPDPETPGSYLIPANATLDVPPTVPDPKRHIAVYRDGEWVVETKASAPIIEKNLAEAPEGMYKRVSIKEALKGGVT